MVTNMVTKPITNLVKTPATKPVAKRSPRRASPPATMSAAHFKARCLELMDAVERTGRSVVVTKRGRPVAMLSPMRVAHRSAFGFMKGRIEILGDIVAPIDAVWNAAR
jgi:prevent-host-death family protein